MLEIATLRANIGKLNERDAEFADSLISQWDRRGLTDKQIAWVKTLAARALGEAPASSGRAQTKVGDLAGIMRLFDKARQHLKFPAIVIGIANAEYRINVAGERARVPGSLNVADPDDKDVWYGRILSSGVFEASPRQTTPAGLTEGLARFAASPAAVAAEHGRLTGRCCFCNMRLKDQRSTSVGYGRTCAGNYGMPYGSAATAAAQFKAA